jgi:diguanylate cyclase (GGDEF)-like protein
MTDSIANNSASASAVSFSRRQILAEFVLCVVLLSGFGAGSLYLVHRDQASHASITQAVVRSGAIDPARQQHHARTQRDLRIMLAISTLLSLALIAAVYWRMDRLCSMFMRARDDAQHEAHHDELTGLPNARLLNDRLAMALAHARRVGETVAVVAVDLDGFRQVNEEHGPNVGDQVLRQAATRLQRLSRDADTVARARDDEFVMVLSDVKSREHAAAFAERLINNLSGAYAVDGSDVTVGAHVGVSLFSGQATNSADLVRLATDALWKARSGGAGRIQMS